MGHVMDAECSRRRLDLLLRIAVCGALVGHGACGAVLAKPAWFTYFAVLGIPEPVARSANLLVIVGTAEIAVGLIVFFFPVPALLLFAALWKIFTELLRPAAGEPFWEFVERASNMIAPLALMYVRSRPAGLSRIGGSHALQLTPNIKPDSVRVGRPRTLEVTARTACDLRQALNGEPRTIGDFSGIPGGDVGPGGIWKEGDFTHAYGD
jgi:hypothetical protein